MAADLLTTWQNKLNREYPDGAVCAWEHAPGDTPVIYVTRRIEVTDMAGLDPVIKIVPVDQSRVLGPVQVASYSEVPEGRWPAGTHRVTFHEKDHYPGVMYWHPKLPSGQAGMLESDSGDGQ